MSEEERGLIRAFWECGKNQKEIAKRLRRSRCVIQNYLRDPDNYGTRKSPGRPSKITPAQKRLLLREASLGNKSADELRRELDLPISTRRVQVVLHDSLNLVSKRTNKDPEMRSAHKKKRRR